MTSPAQLQYLDVMGIPVWVSRELISKHQTISIDTDSRISNIAQSFPQGTPSSIQVSAENSHKPSSVKSNSAQNILNSLDSSTNSARLNVGESQFTAGLNKELHLSVDRAKISIQAQAPSEKPIVSQSSVSGSQNFLYQTSQHYIFSKGNENADWLVIGHSPEPFTGMGNEPFAGESGILLNNMLMAVDLEYPYQQSYIVNVLDVNQSTQSLIDLKQKLNLIIDNVKPKVILLVGQIAAQTMLDSEEPLIIMRSKAHTIGEKNIPCIVSYYPSYLLQKPIDKRKAWNDLKLAKSTLVDGS